jgi:SAM-dependent methyltransferase
VTAVPSPNIWHWPEVYEQENRAQDVDGAIWAALREVPTGPARDVVDIGCGDGFHLPRFAATARTCHRRRAAPAAGAPRRHRVAGLPNVRSCSGQAQRLPLPDASVDLVHARTAYFFGPGCEPGLAEATGCCARRLLAIVDLDATPPPYGDWMRADLPRYDPARSSGSSSGTTSRAPVAGRALAATEGLSLPVSYRVHTRRKPGGLLLPGRRR